ncbi:hypothetical protein Psfp_03776 [Pelotomaculum sp. FP]|nr:hypothetical protein Psfp_03776 [Pelotomaculum sp. FP]
MRRVKLEDLYYAIPEQPIDEKNFDIEKWRRETPMDYLKAIYIMNMADGVAKDVIFKEIYKITRLYIPDVLYKYYSLTDDKKLNSQKFQTLMESKVFLSDVKDFNDPFDGKGYYYDANQLKKFDRLASSGGKLIDDFTSFIKATALTSNGVHSMPMWAHYSNNHTGFCVSYNMKHNMVLSSCTFPVQYTDQRVDVTSLMKQQANMLTSAIEKQSVVGNKKIMIDDLSMVYMTLLLCNLKHVSWSYENEFRCTTGAIAKEMPYIDANPKEIFIGMKCSPEHSKQLTEIAATLNIPVHRMAFNECSAEFDLTTNN